MEWLQSRLRGLLRASRALDDAEDVALLHDDELFIVDLDLGPRPFAEQDAIARLQFEWHELALLVAPAGADGDDFALLRLLLDGVGDDDAACSLLLGVDAADDHPNVQRAKLHVEFSWRLMKIQNCPAGRSARPRE